MKTFTTTAELSHRYHSFFMAILTFPLYFECNDFKCLQCLMPSQQNFKTTGNFSQGDKLSAGPVNNAAL